METSALIGKKVKLVFQDTNAVILKIGIIKFFDNNFLTIEQSQVTEIIPVSRIIRMENLEK